MKDSVEGQPELFELRPHERGWSFTRRAFLGAVASLAPYTPRVTAAPACSSGKAHSDEIRGLVFTTAADVLISSGNDGKIKFWKMPDGAHFRTIVAPKPANGLAVTPDGAFLVAGCSDGIIRMYSLPAGSLWNELVGHNGPVLSVATNPVTGHIASGGADNTVRIWDVPDGNQVGAYWGHESQVASMEFSPYGDLLASGGLADVILWRFPGCEIDGMMRHGAHTGDRPVEAVSWFADNCWLATSWRGQLWLWSLAQRIGQRMPPASIGTGLCFLPDRRELLWIEQQRLSRQSLDELVRFMYSNVNDYPRLKDQWPATRYEEAGAVLRMCVSPDGRCLAIVGEAPASAAGSVPRNALEIWSPGEEKLVAPCMVDRDSTSTGQVMQYKQDDVAYTLPCGTPLPPGATCTCNCVSWSPPPPPPPPCCQSGPCPRPIPPGCICTCNCVSVPCPVHRCPPNVPCPVT